MIRLMFCNYYAVSPPLPSFPTRRSSDLFPAVRRIRVHRDRFVAIADLDKHVEFVRARGSRARMNFVAEINPERLDRKSTRLNSSHLVISYAVFCLKKKKVQIDNKCNLDV